MKSKAFSLLELMAVIGIIGILAAIAVPSYVKYKIKVQISDGVQAIALLHSQLILQNEKGTLGNSVVINGVTFNDNSGVTYNYGAVTSAAYLAAGDGYVPANEWMICVTLGNLSLPAPDTGRNRICSKMKINTSGYTTFCGVWDSSSPFEIPQSYLPPGCNCASVSGESC